MLKNLTVSTVVCAAGFALAAAVIAHSLLSFGSGLASFHIPGILLGIIDVGIFAFVTAVATFVFGMFESFGMGPGRLLSSKHYRGRGGIIAAIAAAAFATLAASFSGVIFSFAQFAPLALAYVTFVLWCFAYFVASFVFKIWADILG